MTGNPPRDGRSLYAWARQVEAAERVGLVKYLDAWAGLRGWPWRWEDWSEEQVAEAYAEAVRRLNRPAWRTRVGSFLRTLRARRRGAGREC